MQGSHIVLPENLERLMIDEKVLVFLALQEVKSYFGLALRVHLEIEETNTCEGSI